MEEKEVAEQRSLSLEEHLEMLDANRAAYGRQVLRTVVYENPHAKKPLPRDIFTGRFDRSISDGDSAVTTSRRFSQGRNLNGFTVPSTSLNWI